MGRILNFSIPRSPLNNTPSHDRNLSHLTLLSRLWQAAHVRRVPHEPRRRCPSPPYTHHARHTRYRTPRAPQGEATCALPSREARGERARHLHGRGPRALGGLLVVNFSRESRRISREDTCTSCSSPLEIGSLHGLGFNTQTADTARQRNYAR